MCDGDRDDTPVTVLRRYGLDVINEPKQQVSAFAGMMTWYRRASSAGPVMGAPEAAIRDELRKGRLSGPRRVRGQSGAGRIRPGASCGGHE